MPEALLGEQEGWNQLEVEPPQSPCKHQNSGLVQHLHRCHR